MLTFNERYFWFVGLPVEHTHCTEGAEEVLKDIFLFFELRSQLLAAGSARPLLA